jgi:endogenous inhibitor of DNA gyrase (YacG/DUF329 family)
MDEPFRRFESEVATAYHWQYWLDARGRRLGIPTGGLNGLESTSAVEHTWGQLQQEGKKTGPVIGPTLDAHVLRRYSPMSREHATLFRTFADLEYTNLQEIGAFVTKYGLLGLTGQAQSLTVHQFGNHRHHHANGESHLDWAREICLMREALQLSRTRTPAEETELRVARNRVRLEPPYEDDREKLAWLFNVHLQHVQGRMMVEADTAPRLSFAPLTLLSAMWLQLALWVAGDKEFRACKHCQRLFEISTEQTGFRKHREFCSESCKTMDYRKRKRTALKLAGEGQSVAVIATRTGTNAATVRAWLAATRKQGKEKR